MKINFSMHYKIIFLVTTFFLLSIEVGAQFYQTGTDPGNINWREINTDHVQIIYPSSNEQYARRLANLLDQTYQLYLLDSFKLKPRKIPVIVHSFTNHSNGFVVWAPKRMEINIRTSQQTYSQPWINQLVLHEYRHVQQISQFDQGITKVFSYLTGEAAIGVASGLFPLWGFEGDAVYAETNYSNAGRGRTPNFTRDVRSLLAKGFTYNYEKAIFGSYRNYIPSFYAYGYMMNTFARYKYGSKFWPEALGYIGRNPYKAYPFFFKLKSDYGLSKKKLYENTMNFYDGYWDSISCTANIADHTEFFNRPQREYKHYTNYQFPQYVNDSLIVAEKNGIDQLREIILMNGKDEQERLIRPGYSFSDGFSISDSILVWTEKEPDIRWEKRDYSVLKRYSLNTGEKKQLSFKSRYFSPDIHRYSGKVAVVSVNEDDEHSLLILEPVHGYIQKSIEIESNTTIQNPSWNASGNKIVMTSVDKSGKSIKIYNVLSENWTLIFGPVSYDISDPVFYQDYILFRGAFDETDNIYAINIESRDLYKLTFSEFGAYDPAVSPDSTELIFSTYHISGYRLAKLSLDPDSWKSYGINFPKSGFIFDHLNISESAVNRYTLNEFSSENDSTYSSKPYRKVSHLFNFHSWMPFYFDMEEFDLSDPVIYPGILLFSQNHLNTAITTVGYAFKDEEHQLITRFVYRGWYPVLDLSFEYGGEPLVAGRPDNRINIQPEGLNRRINARVYLPLNLSRGIFISGFQPSLSVDYDDTYLYDDETSNFTKGIADMEYGVLAYSYLRQSFRDIVPRFGGIARIRHKSFPFNKTNFGTSTVLNGTFYLPGLWKHHSVKLGLGMQFQNPEKYLINLSALYPRGYNRYISEAFNTFSLEYIMPLLYPDLRIWNLAYIKRIHGQFFYDRGRGTNIYFPGENGITVRDDQFTSYGIDLLSELHLVHILFPLQLGIRFVYLENPDRYSINMLLNIDITNF